jgi:hypothetical protein
VVVFHEIVCCLVRSFSSLDDFNEMFIQVTPADFGQAEIQGHKFLEELERKIRLFGMNVRALRSGSEGDDQQQQLAKTKSMKILEMPCC